MLHVVLADDHPLMRSALRALFADLGQTHGHAIFCLDAVDQGELQTLFRSGLHIHLAVVDICMGSSAMEGLTQAPGTSREDLSVQRLVELSQAYPDVPLIVLSGFLQPQWIPVLRTAPGVRAILSKESSLIDLRLVAGDVIRSIAHDPVGQAQDVPRKVKAPPDDQASSAAKATAPRLAEIHRLITEGASNKVIARRLGLSEGTVKNYVSQLFRQLKVSNRVSAAMAPPGPSPDSGLSE